MGKSLDYIKFMKRKYEDKNLPEYFDRITALIYKEVAHISQREHVEGKTTSEILAVFEGTDESVLATALENVGNDYKHVMNDLSNTLANFMSK